MKDAWAGFDNKLASMLNILGIAAAHVATAVGWLATIAINTTPAGQAAALAEKLAKMNQNPDALPPAAQFLQNIANEAGKRRLPPIAWHEEQR